MFIIAFIAIAAFVTIGSFRLGKESICRELSPCVEKLTIPLIFKDNFDDESKVLREALDCLLRCCMYQFYQKAIIEGYNPIEARFMASVATEKVRVALLLGNV